MLRSPSLRASTGLLGLGVLLWLLLRAPVSTPHHGITAHASFQVLARHLHEPSALARDPVTRDLFVAEAETGVILRIDPEGRINTFATGFRRPLGLAFPEAKNFPYGHLCLPLNPTITLEEQTMALLEIVEADEAALLGGSAVRWFE
jgi:hypothetical protein